MSDEVAAPVEQKAPETSETSATTTTAATEEVAAPAADVKADDAQPPASGKGDKLTAEDPSTASADENPSADTDVDMKDASDAEKSPETADKAEDTESAAQPATDKATGQDKPAATEDKSAEMGKEQSAPPAAESTPANKNRRKSAVASTGKKLNKKQSKAKIQHLDATPGNHFFARLKGFPPWPVIVCDEEMLPQNMITSRPVTAAKPDGTYRDDFADGGKRVGDRSFPVMYLQTNEFSWTRNTDLDDLDFDVVADLVTPKMRKDLAAAHHLASEKHDLEHYKTVLRDFQEAKLAELEAKQARARAKKEKTSKKSEPKVEDEDVDMPDVEDQEGEESDGKKATKKRKAEDEGATPQRSESVKKPKIKLTTSSTPKTATNGTQSPKESTAKASKAKSKASKPAKEVDGEKTKKKEDKEPAPPKEPELTPEEKHVRKEKEILFLRHRLQKGLLNREAAIKEADMQNMSDYLAKLEGFPDLEAVIIRVTKINKVLKAMLKLSEIPKEAEFNFKPRSQTLLDKWNKILLAEPAPATEAATPANGVNGSSEEAAASKQTKEPTNGVNGDSDASKVTAKEEKTELNEEVKESSKSEEKTESTPSSEKPAEEKTASAEPAAAPKLFG